MSGRGNLIGLTVLAAIAVLAAYTGWRVNSAANAAFCRVCNRPVHDENRTLARLDGRSEVFCCPTCALNAGVQRDTPVEFLKVTENQSKKQIDPATAYAVEGSEVNHCLNLNSRINEDKQPVTVNFDRCSPSIVVFGGESSARQFAARHGGTAGPFARIAARAR